MTDLEIGKKVGHNLRGLLFKLAHALDFNPHRAKIDD